MKKKYFKIPKSLFNCSAIKVEGLDLLARIIAKLVFSKLWYVGKSVHFFSLIKVITERVEREKILIFVISRIHIIAQKKS